MGIEKYQAKDWSKMKFFGTQYRYTKKKYDKHQSVFKNIKSTAIYIFKLDLPNNQFLPGLF